MRAVHFFSSILSFPTPKNPTLHHRSPQVECDAHSGRIKVRIWQWIRGKLGGVVPALVVSMYGTCVHYSKWWMIRFVKEPCVRCDVVRHTKCSHDRIILYVHVFEILINERWMTPALQDTITRFLHNRRRWRSGFGGFDVDWRAMPSRQCLHIPNISSRNIRRRRMRRCASNFEHCTSGVATGTR